MAFTVTATPGGASFSRGVDILVRVYTNATEAGGASSGSRNTAAVAAQGTLTPNFSSSAVVFAISSDGATTNAAAATNNTYDANGPAHTDTWIGASGHYTGTVTSGTALTYGAGAAASGADHENWCAYEVPASGGTITLDGSSPAGVSSDTGATATSGSFTPPVGSVVVVTVIAGGTAAGAGVTCTISDTSGLSMTWTQRVTSSTADNFQPTFIFTTTIPAAPPVKSVNPAQARTSRTWQRRFNHFVRPNIPPSRQQIGANAGVATVAASAQIGKKVITGLAGGTAGHFVNQYGAPTFFANATVYGLPSNAGRWNGGNWQADYDSFFADIAAQGNTVAEIDPFGHSHIGANNDLGNTYDGVSPWTTLPALNNTFWQRIDYLCASAQNNGITVLMVLCACFDMGTNAFTGTGVFNGVSAANVQSALQNIAARYASQPNLLILFGDDYNEDDDTRMSAGLTGLRAGGYTGPVSIENYPSGTTSRRDLSAAPTGTPFVWGGANANWNWGYYYWVAYFAVEQAYKENNQIPVVSGDGWYAGAGAGEPDDSHLMRNQTWWALASGARGRTMGSETILQWQSGAFTDLLTNQKWFSVNQLAVVNAFTGLAGWQNLLPDLTSSLVTAGRGTRSAYSSSTFQSANLGTDNYVAASVTPDKSLAVIYCAVAMSITIDQTQIATGYTATWMDPANGALTPTTTGSTYSSSGLGNNSAGNADWVLVLQGPPAVTAAAGVATVSVVAPQPAPAVTVTAGVAAVSAIAPAATVAETGNPAPAVVNAVAAAPVVAETVTASVAVVSAVAPAAAAALVVFAGVAVVNAVAPAAAVSTSGGTTAPAGVAVVSVIAPAATIAETAAAGVAPVSAVAPAPSVAETATAAVAVVNATAPAPAAAEAATAAVAAVSAVAPQPQAAIVVVAGVAVVNAVAPAATVNTSGSTNAVAGVAAVQAIAPAPSPALVVFAGVATVQAIATAATAGTGTVAAAGVATISAKALASASLAATATAQAAVAAARGVDVPPVFTLGTLTASDGPTATLTASDQRTGGPS